MKNLRLKCCNLNFQPPLFDHCSHWFLIYRGMKLENHQELSRVIPSLEQLAELELHWVLVTEGHSLPTSREITLLWLSKTLRLNKNLEILIFLLSGICLICVPLGHIERAFGVQCTFPCATGIKIHCNSALQSGCPICQGQQRQQGPGFHEQWVHMGTIMQYRDVVSHLCFFKLTKL